jgi:hypothetical protein
MVELELPKLAVRVRFPSPAPPFALVVQSGLARLSFLDRPAPLDPTGLEGTAAGRYDGGLAAGYFLRDLARVARGDLPRPSRSALWAIPLAVGFSLLLMLVWFVVLALTSSS